MIRKVKFYYFNVDKRIRLSMGFNVLLMDLPRKSYTLVSGITKKSLHLSDGVSERVRE